MSRSKRRHHLQRMKIKAKKVYSSNEPKNAIKLANHLQCCSCMGCGNPRHHFNAKTKQECKAYLKYLEEIDDNYRTKHLGYDRY